MQVHREINRLPSFRNAVITIGTFDGVHTGHLQIIKLLKKESAEVNGESVIITFHPHPRMIVGRPSVSIAGAEGLGNAEKSISLLNTLAEKTELIEKQGIDHLVIVPFTEAFSLLSAEDYAKKFLVEKFHPHTIIIGYDHHFGNQRQGNYKLLEAYAGNFNYVVKEIPEHVINHVAISSTTIRKAIMSGDIQTANKFLGYSFFFEGVVTEGDRIGRSLGFPTANLTLNDENKILPADGVYAVEVSLAPEDASLHGGVSPGNAEIYNHRFPATPGWNGMMNIGYRPTIGGTKKMIEVNLFEFDKDIYGRQMRVFVKNYLRSEIKFRGLEALKEQLSTDKKLALKRLRSLHPDNAAPAEKDQD